MKCIGIISDTHGFLDSAVLENFSLCDEIWHAGDFGKGVSEALEAKKILKGVSGNIDGHDIRWKFAQSLHFFCEEVNVFITHIGGYPGRYEPKVKHQLELIRPDLFISGHSHILKIIRDPKINNLLHINPGAAGKLGFHQMRTIIRLKIDYKRIFDVEIIELGKRVELLNKKN
ncbi:MAG: metallophosphoesterase family protein [Chitinophagales bacterium]|nr:metallophosphoesterase family protein [Chitinophagales bacterium]